NSVENRNTTTNNETEPQNRRSFCSNILRAHCARPFVFCHRLGGGTANTEAGWKSAGHDEASPGLVLLGQSNMLGMGKIAGGEGSLENAVKNKNKYPYLV